MLPFASIESLTLLPFTLNVIDSRFVTFFVFFKGPPLFRELSSRWTCAINSADLGNTPSSMSGHQFYHEKQVLGNLLYPLHLAFDVNGLLNRPDNQTEWSKKNTEVKTILSFQITWTSEWLRWFLGLLAALWQLETGGKPQLFLSQTQEQPDHTRSGHMCQLYRGQTTHDGADRRLGINILHFLFYERESRWRAVSRWKRRSRSTSEELGTDERSGEGENKRNTGGEGKKEMEGGMEGGRWEGEMTKRRAAEGSRAAGFLSHWVTLMKISIKRCR